MVIISFAIIRIRRLFAVVILTGIFSLLAAVLYVVLAAVDVAFTEAAVGAGISTLLMLATLSLTANVEKAHKGWKPITLLIVIVTGGLLIWGTLDMPLYGDPEAPSNKHVAPRYINDSMGEVGMPNIVTSVLASYRSFDTLGEVVVIFTAGIGVLILLGRGHNRWRPGQSNRVAPIRREEDV